MKTLGDTHLFNPIARLRHHFFSLSANFLSLDRLSRNMHAHMPVHTLHTKTHRHVRMSNLGRERKHTSGESLDESHEYQSVWLSKQKVVSKHNRSENIHFLWIETGPNWGETVQLLAILSPWLVVSRFPSASYTTVRWTIVYFSLVDYNPLVSKFTFRTAGTNCAHCELLKSINCPPFLYSHLGLLYCNKT